MSDQDKSLSGNEQNNDYKKNNLHTKHIPALFMLTAGLIAFIICLIKQSEIHAFLLTVFLSMLIFAIIGTIVKIIVDNFNMNLSYDDFLDDDDDGEIREK